MERVDYLSGMNKYIYKGVPIKFALIPSLVRGTSALCGCGKTNDLPGLSDPIAPAQSAHGVVPNKPLG